MFLFRLEEEWPLFVFNFSFIRQRKYLKDNFCSYVVKVFLLQTFFSSLVIIKFVKIPLTII